MKKRGRADRNPYRPRPGYPLTRPPEERRLTQALAAWLAEPSSLAAPLPDWPAVLRGFFSRCLALEADSRAQTTAAM